MRTRVSIAPKSGKRPKVGHRPTHPRVAHCEDLVDAIVVCTQDAEICRASAQALREITWARHHFERELLDKAVSRSELLDAFGDLDRLERRVQDILNSRGLHLETRTIPYFKERYRDVEFV